MFHVEQDASDELRRNHPNVSRGYYQERPSDLSGPDSWALVYGFLVPTTISRRRELGTGIGSCQSQFRFLLISGRSFAPIQRITCSAAKAPECAHSRNLEYSPRAREQT